MTTRPPSVMTPRAEDLDRDLGMGSRVADRRGSRFLNQDGSFNVRRKGQSLLESLNVFHWLLNLSSWRFGVLIVATYMLTNVFFAIGYFLCGPEGFVGAVGTGMMDRFLDGFFFSVQTLATIGYGRISPNTLAANVLVTIESLVGLMGFAIITGIIFARFSRPTAEIIFSHRAVIAPYRGISGFMFRIVNARTNQLISMEAVVNMGRMEEKDGQAKRAFYTLELERRKVQFFPLHWVIVHPITENSPLYGWTAEQLAASDAEFTILLTATDETFSQTVHARSSYKPSEIVWAAKFTDMFEPSDDGVPTVDLGKLHDIERAALPELPAARSATPTA
jgi:inward rectifier potassium channel